MMSPDSPFYLGDGVFVELDHVDVILRTDRHVIVLDPQVLNALMLWLSRSRLRPVLEAGTPEIDPETGGQE